MYLRLPAIYACARKAGVEPTPEDIAHAASLPVEPVRRALNGERVSTATWQGLQRWCGDACILTETPPTAAEILALALDVVFQYKLDALESDAERQQRACERIHAEYIERIRVLGAELGR
jgi:hypothetical protein